MGTTLHALVEAIDDDFCDCIAEWHFGKCYELMYELDQSEHTKGFPSGCSFRGKYLIEHDIADFRQTFIVEQLPKDSSIISYIAMLASLQIYIDQQIEVRVLFYRR